MSESLNLEEKNKEMIHISTLFPLKQKVFINFVTPDIMLIILKVYFHKVVILIFWTIFALLSYIYACIYVHLESLNMCKIIWLVITLLLHCQGE